MQRVHAFTEAWIYPLAALALVVSALLSVVALVRFSTGEVNYFTFTFGVGGIACLMLTLWLWRNWKSPKVIPVPEQAQVRSDTQVALDAANAEFDDFERAFALSSDDPFRGMVHDSWEELYKLLTSGGSAGEVRAARMNLAYYWERWKQNASARVEEGQTKYMQKYAVSGDSAPEQTSVQTP